MATQYLTVPWEQFHRDARQLASHVIDGNRYRGIIAIARGGLIPAAIIARELDIRLVECVSIETYQDETLGKPRVTKAPSAAGDGDGYLLVDDLVDTGSTARVARALLPKARFACIYAKPAGRPLVDVFVREVPQDTWILFPWDTEPQFSTPLIRRDPR